MSTTAMSWHVDERGARSHQALHRLGAGVRIAVLDTGIDASHPEFKGQRIGRLDVCRRRGEGEDRNGHGTHIASLLAGRRVGIAPEAELLSIKVSCGRRPATQEHLLTALDMCDKYNVDLIHLSFGSVNHYPAVERAIEAYHRRGVLTVAAAGLNDRGYRYYPGGYRCVLGVGALNREGSAVYQPFCSRTKLVDLGESVTGAWIGGAYRTSCGCSIAAAITCGLVTLWLAAGGAGPKTDRLLGETQLDWLQLIAKEPASLEGQKLAMLCPERLFSSIPSP